MTPSERLLIEAEEKTRHIALVIESYAVKFYENVGKRPTHIVLPAYLCCLGRMEVFGIVVLYGEVDSPVCAFRTGGDDAQGK